MLWRIDGFAISFMRMKLRREPKKDYRKVGESEAGIKLQDN